MLAIAVLVASSAISQAAANPYEIYARARRYVETQRYPGMLEYTVVVHVTEGGRERVERYQCGYNAYAGTISFDPVSDYEKTHPYMPHGINVGVLIWQVGKPEPPVDYLGVPDFAPNYSFGLGSAPLTPLPRTPTPAELVREIRAELHDPDPRATPIPSPSPSATPALREIATVVGWLHFYDITLAGIEDVDGSPAYDLKLRPLREPHKYRLRELWVDKATFAPRKLIEAIDFVDGPGTAVPWSVTFQNLGGALYVDRQTALAPMNYRGLEYTSASVSVEGVHVVTQLSRELSTFQPGGLMMREP